MITSSSRFEARGFELLTQDIDRGGNMQMRRLLYEKSVSYGGYLIIPFVHGLAAGRPLCSYRLLSEQAHRGQFHRAENPADRYTRSVDAIIAAAQEHLDRHLKPEEGGVDYFQRRYTYCNHLIVLHPEADKVFYDHYQPEDLNNIAAPKLFASELACVRWVREGIDQLHAPPLEKPVNS